MKRILLLLFILLLAELMFAGDISRTARIGFIHDDSSYAYRLGFSRKAETQPLVDDSGSLTRIDMTYLLDSDYFHSSYFYAYFQSFSVNSMRVELHATDFKPKDAAKENIKWIYTGDIKPENRIETPDQGYDMAFLLFDEAALGLGEDELSLPRFYNCSILIAVEGSKMENIDESGYSADFMLKLIANE